MCRLMSNVHLASAESLAHHGRYTQDRVFLRMLLEDRKALLARIAELEAQIARCEQERDWARDVVYIR